jgi:hypothetical protein
VQIQTDNKGTLEQFQTIVDSVCSYDDVRSIGVFVCDANDFSPEDIESVLQRVKVPLFGGVFPALINGNQKLEKGSLVIGLPFDIQVCAIEGLSNPKQDYDRMLEDLLPDLDACRTLLVFVDGFSARIGSFIEGLFNVFGLEINYIGGGAGSLSMNSTPCLFTDNGVLQDSAILIGIDARSGVGVSHGWKSIRGPFKVTEADHNRIISLDWLPAFDVYRQVIASHSGKQIDSDSFYDIASAYPFGITKMEAERVVRDPVLVDEQGALLCVGEVTEGTFVDILNGDDASLINAAGTALTQAQQDFGPMEDSGLIFLVDCISRALFLDDRFEDELNVACRTQRPVAGVCSLGEIANNGQAYLEFYNKTCVVGIMTVQ